MITIIDYGMGNLGSILNMLKKIGASAQLSSDIKEIESSEKIILPGVGAFDMAMSNIQSLNLKTVLNKKALEDKVPILGICLGMQLLTEDSEEGTLKGMCWIPGHVKRFKFGHQMADNLKIPHMGWNQVNNVANHPLFHHMSEDMRFYFVHSYHFKCHLPENSIGETTYGFPFTSAVAKENIMGVQFHPEKSHKFGMQLLKNFVTI